MSFPKGDSSPAFACSLVGMHRTSNPEVDVFGPVQEDARKMVLTMVEMERSYLTAEVFREILQQNGRSDHSGELIRTLSGRQVRPCQSSHCLAI